MFAKIFTNNQKPRLDELYLSTFEGNLINHCSDVCTETRNTTSLSLSPLSLMNRPLLQSETRSKTSEHHTGAENLQEAAVSEDR